MSLISRTIKFEDSSALQNRPGYFMDITVNAPQVYESWKASVLAPNWLDANGTLKNPEHLAESAQKRWFSAHEKLQKNGTLEKPVLGIGVYDNIEIGQGVAEFLMLITHGFETIPVHIPKSSESDFKDYRADVDWKA